MQRIFIKSQAFAVVAVLLTVFMCVHFLCVKAQKPQNVNSAAAQYASQRKYRLVWKDDFKGSKLDDTKWSKIARKPWACFAHMSDDPKLYEIKSGRLRLYCARNTSSSDTARVITGGVTTEDKMPIKYGKVEVRARFKGATGCWPAIWLASCKQACDDPKWAEIDIVERYNHNNQVVMTAHNCYGSTWKKQSESERNVKVDVNVSRWNVYAVEILPDCLIFSVNGKDVKVYKKMKNVEGQFPYGIAKYLRIDMQWGNDYLKDLREDELPAWMDIDWVKFYEKQ